MAIGGRPGEEGTERPGESAAGAESESRRAVRTAAEEILAKARAAAEESWQGPRGAEILANARAAADDIRARAPEAARPRRRSGPPRALRPKKSWPGADRGREILAGARAAEGQVTLPRSGDPGPGARGRGGTPGPGPGAGGGDPRAAPEVISRVRAMDRRTLLTVAAGGIIAAVLGERFLRYLRAAPPARPTTLDVTAGGATSPDGTGVGFGTPR